MKEEFWRAKIWGLLHDPVLKALHRNISQDDKSDDGCWQLLDVMNGWQLPKETAKGKAIADSCLIASASDRPALENLSESVDYGEEGLEIFHLLSGQHVKFDKASNRLFPDIGCKRLVRYWKLVEQEHQKMLEQKGQGTEYEYLKKREEELFPGSIRTEKDALKVFWWLWRCLPEATCQAFGDNPTMLLMPAENRLPDSSIWSHTSISAALAGAIAGCDVNNEETSHPYLATFTFTPVQELIVASRKIRDLWAGSWILHYLSAKICWKLANLYGPDSFLYPSLYEQPLIDHWLLEQYPEWKKGDKDGWIKPPHSHKLLTAGFPNVLVLVLPKDRLKEAMQTAEQTLKEEWRGLGKAVFHELEERNWMPELQETSCTWRGWLEAQWQVYWSAVPIGVEGKSPKDTGILIDEKANVKSDPWVKDQNHAYIPSSKRHLFLDEELIFLRSVFNQKDSQEDNSAQLAVNVGSWWGFIFDSTRAALSSIKNARTWQLPTAFGPRSTVSGIGPVVHPNSERSQHDWISEADTKEFWKNRKKILTTEENTEESQKSEVGFFDGIEQLNATETVKRCLHEILPQLFDLSYKGMVVSYPDLTAGAAGYLKKNQDRIEHFIDACDSVLSHFKWSKKLIKDMKGKWGIPWADIPSRGIENHHSRLLNAGWLTADLGKEKTQKIQTDVLNEIKKYYPNNNPTDWYVLAAGDGDGMSDWLKGKHMDTYYQYIPEQLQRYAGEAPAEGVALDPEASIQEKFGAFAHRIRKRMGPSTHSALSRALLDFSNQLAPYLTEQRYAGRLIYSGGDDVLAYTNLWEWDEWLWDIRQCFRGEKDEHGEFGNEGNYWQWKRDTNPYHLPKRPLFTMGQKATISFGIVIAHHSVPLAIALENLRDAEKSGAKEYKFADGQPKKDAVQVRVLYGNGNILKATSKFEVFNTWRKLFELPNLDAALFEQAAVTWSQHPIPVKDAIEPWTQAFCNRREQFANRDEDRQEFQQALKEFIEELWKGLREENVSDEVQSWLKLAAFVIRKREITIR